MTSAFTGLLAYPITPLGADGDVDLDALEGLVGRAAAAGVDGVTVLATSGAGVSFDDAERDAVVRVALAAAGTTPVHVGVAGESAHRVTGRARAAVAAGAAGLVLPPFSYLPLDDAEVRALFARVGAAAAGAPACFYNKPVQLGLDVSPALLADLAADGSVVAVKDPASLPSRPAGRVAELRAAAPGVAVGLSGDPALVGGAEPADAWHTGLAALAPAEYVAVRAARVAGPEAGDGGAQAAAAWLLDLARAVAATGRAVAALHAVAALLGTPTAPPRDALVPLTAADEAALRDVVAGRPAS
ncbi:dihydrodipicolinate synthase family protein [Isoptericola sp. NPDC057653]|uniref:dihydrodipicolinate synthase family protein n=1 Tax=Isoptericola sp. NPDC057653 TaxID=3346195 RepID=UPI00369D4941